MIFFSVLYLHCDNSCPLFIAEGKRALPKISIIRCVLIEAIFEYCKQSHYCPFCGLVYEYYFRDLKNLFSKLVTELSVSFHCFRLEKIFCFQYGVKSRQLDLNSPAVVQLPYIFQYKYSSFYLQAFRPRPNMRRSFCGIHETSNNDRDISSMHGPRFPMNRGRILLLNAISLYPPVLRSNIVLLLLLSSEEQGAKVWQVL